MEYRGLTIDEIKKIDDKKELLEWILSESVVVKDKYNAFVTITDEASKEQLASKKEGLLSGVPYSLKDNFSTAGILTTASSNILKDYVPVYNSTVYQKLLDSGAVLTSKATLDELAMGGTGTTGHTGAVSNPWNKKHLIGGSSAGSAVAVATGLVPFSIGSDTGDSVRKPAAFGGVVGFKPTYGRISRYGLFAFASSLDHVGVLARNVKDTAIVTDVLKGLDEKDMTSLPNENIMYHEKLDGNVKGKKLFYIKEVLDLNNYDEDDKEIREHFSIFNNTLDKCRDLGIEVVEESFPMELLKAMITTYITISCAEATSNNSNLTGIIFGPRGEGESVDEIMFSARTNGFSELIKRRFVIGSYVLQKENQEKLFLNSQRVRRLIVEKTNELFKKYDGMILPVGIGPAPKEEPEVIDELGFKKLVCNETLLFGNFGGYPSITIPNGFIDGMPVAFNITGAAKDDFNVLNIAYAIENTMGFKNQIAKEAK